MTETHHKYDTARSELLPFVPVDARRLLDIGCGVGRYAQEIRLTRPEIELWGVEPDPDAQVLARQHVHRLLAGTLEEVTPHLAGQKFDVVTFNDVLEHVLEPTELLDAVKPYLTEGSGVVVASIPNTRHRSVLWPLLRRGEWNYEKHGLLDSTHLRFFTKQTMRALFEDNGWEVRSVVGINSLWDWRDEEHRRWVRAANLLTRGVSADFFFVQYVVTAAPVITHSEA